MPITKGYSQKKQAFNIKDNFIALHLSGSAQFIKKYLNKKLAKELAKEVAKEVAKTGKTETYGESQKAINKAELSLKTLLKRFTGKIKKPANTPCLLQQTASKLHCKFKRTNPAIYLKKRSQPAVDLTRPAVFS